MESLIIFLLVSITGSSGFFHYRSICNPQTSEAFNEMMENFPPNEQELKRSCPGLLVLIECYENEVKNITGETFQELANSSDETVAQEATFLCNLYDLTKDICSESTQFHKNYIENSQCLKEVLPVEMHKCISESRSLFNAFINSTFAEEGAFKEFECVRSAYEWACAMQEVRTTCGETAKNVVLEAVRRLQVLKKSKCTDKSLILLRGKFLDFLEQQGKDRGYYSTAFEF